MLKIGQNWNKTANYPTPQCLTKIGTPGRNAMNVMTNIPQFSFGFKGNVGKENQESSGYKRGHCQAQKMIQKEGESMQKRGLQILVAALLNLIH